MTEMTAFERQLSGEIGDLMGPVHPVDDLAIFESVTAASRSQRWGFTMFSALKFATAGAIVALFGGFLLVGILSAPQDGNVLPAAVTESPSPMTTEELLSGMVTEEVEPGVFRVVNDGVRDLTYPLGGWDYSGFMVDVTPDGSVWLSVDEGEHDLFRLGEEQVFEDPWTRLWFRGVAPDGSLWGLGEVPDDRWGISSFDGEEWTVRATMTDIAVTLAVGPDGTVWVVAEDGDKYCPDIEGGDCPGIVLLRLEDDDSLTTMDWSDVYDGDADWLQLAVSPDGDVWLVGTQRAYYPRAEVLLRFDGEGWEAIPGPEGWNPVGVGRYLEVGSDGTLWVKTDARGGLARFDDPGWTTFTEADGLMEWGVEGGSFADMLNVAADGSLWLLGSPTDPLPGCGGVTHFDGTTWTSYLVETCMHDFAIAPDGSVWLGANAYGDGASLLHLYVITPEAVAGTQ